MAENTDESVFFFFFSLCIVPYLNVFSTVHYTMEKSKHDLLNYILYLFFSLLDLKTQQRQIQTLS